MSRLAEAANRKKWALFFSPTLSLFLSSLSVEIRKGERLTSLLFPLVFISIGALRKRERKRETEKKRKIGERKRVRKDQNNSKFVSLLLGRLDDYLRKQTSTEGNWKERKKNDQLSCFHQYRVGCSPLFIDHLTLSSHSWVKSFIDSILMMIDLEIVASIISFVSTLAWKRKTTFDW